MKDKVIIIILVSALLVAGIIILKQNQTIESLKPSSSHFLSEGEEITYFDLIGKDGEKVDISGFKNKPLTVIFIFKLPCAHCSGNIIYWNRIAKILKEDAVIYGIIPGDKSIMLNLYKKARLRFKLFVPEDTKKFKETMKIKMNLENTILYYKNMVIKNAAGEIDGNIYTDFLRAAKSIQGGAK